MTQFFRFEAQDALVQRLAHLLLHSNLSLIDLTDYVLQVVVLVHLKLKVLGDIGPIMALLLRILEIHALKQVASVLVNVSQFASLRINHVLAFFSAGPGAAQPRNITLRSVRRLL